MKQSLMVLLLCFSALAVGGAARAAGMANPASVNCEEQGGALEIKKSPAGEYGVCKFGPARQCEEWALFRGECPKGGVDISAFKRDADIMCAITGGRPEGGQCVRKKTPEPKPRAASPRCGPPAGGYTGENGVFVSFGPAGKGLWNGKKFNYSAQPTALPDAKCGALKLSGEAPLSGIVAFSRGAGGAVQLYGAAEGAKTSSGCAGKPVFVLSPAKNAPRGKRPLAR